MATISQIRGMLLEEAVLYLLGRSGYHTVEYSPSDPTVHDGPSGLTVEGRGARHQIDAVADYCIAQPFCYPQRLLVEAKCYDPHYSVGLGIVRNAVGVVRDVEEYWTPGNYSPLLTRYHYLYAIFSASGFTEPAEKYAFAQGVYLMPLAGSKFLERLLRAIRDISHNDFGAPSWNSIIVDMTRLRKAVRQSLQYLVGRFEDLRIADEAQAKLAEFVRRCQRIEGALLGTIAKRFPVFLIPSPSIDLNGLRSFYSVHIYWDQNGWYLRSSEDGSLLFSFDLPLVLFREYAEGRFLSASQAIELKAEYLSEIQAMLMIENQVQLVRFRVDGNWLSTIRERTERRQPEPPAG